MYFYSSIEGNGPKGINYDSDDEISEVPEESKGIPRILRRDFIDEHQLQLSQFNQGMKAMNNLLQETLLDAFSRAQKRKL